MSKYIPNSYQAPNAYIDELMHLLTGNEFKCLMYAVRHINGWQDRIERGYAHISLSMFRDGFETVNGKRFNGTGLARSSIASAVNRLCAFGILVKIGGKCQKGQAYALGDNINYKELSKRNSGKSPSVPTGGTLVYQQAVHSVPTDGTKQTHIKTQETIPKEKPDNAVMPNGIERQDNAFKLKAVIEEHLGIKGQRAFMLSHVFNGTHKKQKYKEYTVIYKDKPCTPEQLIGAVNLYKETYPDTAMMQSPEVIDDFIHRYRDKPKADTIEVKETELDRRVQKALKEGKL